MLRLNVFQKSYPMVVVLEMLIKSIIIENLKLTSTMVCQWKISSFWKI